jgi:hypothetical protein
MFKSKQDIIHYSDNFSNLNLLQDTTSMDELQLYESPFLEDNGC